MASAAAATYDHFQWHASAAVDSRSAVVPLVVGASDDLMGVEAAETPASPAQHNHPSLPSSPVSSSTSPSVSLMDLGAVLDGSASSTSSMDILSPDVSPSRLGLGASAASSAGTVDGLGSPGGSAEASWDEGAYASPPSLSCWASAWPVTRRSSRRRCRGKRGGGGSGSSVGSPSGSWPPPIELGAAAAAGTFATADAAARVRAAAAAAEAAGVAVPAASSSAGLSSTLTRLTTPPLPTVPSWAATDDVTAAHVSAGRDVQGIPWETMLFSRESYRGQRLTEQRVTYASSRGVSAEEGSGIVASTSVVAPAAAARARTSSPLFAPRMSAAVAPDTPLLASGTRPLRALRFVHTTRQVRCSVNHFQLRNLVWAPTAHDAYLLQDNGVVHWDAVTRSRRSVVDLSGASPGLPRVQVSTMTAGAGLLLAGGFDGELVAAATDGAVLACGRLASSAAITTGLAVYDQDASHGPSIITCSNDTVVRTFDAASLASPAHSTAGAGSTTSCGAGIGGTVSGSVATHRLPWAANHVSRQPRGGSLLAVAGDHASVLLLDTTAGNAGGLGGRSRSLAPAVATLVGHTDDCFATAWAPDGVVVATGSQDGTARLWDIRRPTTALGIVGGPANGPVRSLRFSPCGRLLAVAEPRDYVRVVDVASVARCGGGDGGRAPAAQDVDVFGEVGGVAWTPEGGRLYVGVHDDNYGCLLEMEVRSGRRSAADAMGL